MKVLFVETHYKDISGGRRTSAVDWWRIVNPAIHLQKNTDWKIEIRKGVLSRDDFRIDDPQADFEWECIGKNWDLVWFSYIENPIAYSYMKVVSQKFGVKFILDLDDNMLDPVSTNLFFINILQVPRAYRDFQKIIYDTPYLSVTNSFLKKTYKKFRNRKEDDIFVLDNYIDLEVYKAKPHIEDDVITIGWFGGVNHYDDLFKSPFGQAMPYILGKYDNVKFEMIGFLPDSYFEGLPRFKRIDGSSDFYKWVKIWQERTRHWDIGVCPLEDSNFNKGKSSIKTYEMAAAKLPVVVSDVRPYQYIQDGKTGFKCRNTRDWIAAIEELIENKSKRKELGENLYQEVKNHRTINNNWVKWKEVTEKVVRKK